jgi:alpha-tubulin suppressor-like RCC1 family protein
VLGLGGTFVMQLAAGFRHTCARLSTGVVRCWGAGPEGELGIGTFPDGGGGMVIGISTAVHIAAGYDTSCAALLDGTVRCWGRNVGGQLGDGTMTNRATPVAVVGLSNATRVAVSSSSACALLTDGTVSCWGGGSRSPPVAVGGISGAVDVVAGDRHTCVLLASGSVRCWGFNGQGQLGDGTTVLERSSPSTVSGITTATQLAAGFSHNCARLANGTLRCWGSGGGGAMGNGTTAGDNVVPVTPAGILTATMVTCGNSWTCALLADRTLRCWGYNISHQLGDGTTTDRLTPPTTPTAMGGIMCGAAPGAPAAEVCNGVDDNCDGAVDNNCM